MTDDAARLPGVRASDADREAVVVRLQAALAEGGIDVDEFEQRAGAAYAAVTTAELRLGTVFGDKRIELAPVPRVPGTPPVLVTARTVFGDLRLRSLAPGEPTNRWRARLERWR